MAAWRVEVWSMNFHADRFVFHSLGRIEDRFDLTIRLFEFLPDLRPDSAGEGFDFPVMRLDDPVDPVALLRGEVQLVVEAVEQPLPHPFHPPPRRKLASVVKIRMIAGHSYEQAGNKGDHHHHEGSGARLTRRRCRCLHQPKSRRCSQP